MSEQPFSSFHLRIGILDDVPAMASLAAKSGRDPTLVARGCERILRERFGFSVVAMGRTDGSERLVGFMNVPLLRPRFGKRVRCGGVPFSVLLATENDRFIADESEVGRGNGDSGHDLFISHHFQEPCLSPKNSERMTALLVSGFVDRYAGNHVRAVLAETKGIEAARDSEYGGYSIVETYDEWFKEAGVTEAERPILIQSDRDRAIKSHNYHLARVLDYQAPNLRLPPAAREVVRCAYLGYTDAQIVADLSITSASLNSRWSRILDIAEAKMPSMFARGSGGRTRDRLPLLTYLRTHPEEMWPYEPQPSAED